MVAPITTPADPAAAARAACAPGCPQGTWVDVLHRPGLRRRPRAGAAPRPDQHPGARPRPERSSRSTAAAVPGNAPATPPRSRCWWWSAPTVPSTLIEDDGADGRSPDADCRSTRPPARSPSAPPRRARLPARHPHMDGRRSCALDGSPAAVEGRPCLRRRPRLDHGPPTSPWASRSPSRSARTPARPERRHRPPVHPARPRPDRYDLKTRIY